jgi:hypothetical protein
MAKHSDLKKTYAVLLLLFTSVLASGKPAQALETLCRNVHTADRFWKDRSPFVISKTAGGDSLYTTYSFDSEIVLGDFWGEMDKHLDAVTLQKATEDMNKVFPRVAKEELIEKLGYSEKQLALFALKKGIDSTQRYFNFTDLKPRTMSILRVGQSLTGNQYLTVERLLREDLIPLLNRQGLAVKTHIDLSFPELTHPTSSTNPADYAQDIKRLHEIFPRAATHFHVGLPTEAVTQNQAFEIARAIEAKTVLILLIHSNLGSASRLEYRATTFENWAVANNRRGVVKLALNGFWTPFPAHDLELRQWYRTDDALESIETASQLAQRAVQNQLTSYNVLPGLALYSDVRFGALAASLDYIGQVLEHSPQNAALGVQLRAWAQQSTLPQNWQTRFEKDGIRQEQTSGQLKTDFLKKLILFVNKSKVLTIYEQTLRSSS